MNKDHYLIDLSGSERTDYGRTDFEKQSSAQKTFSAIWELESQVNNGGFEQYFRSADTDVILYAPVALRNIGADTCAGLVDQALAIVSPLPEDFDAKYDVLDSLEDGKLDSLNALDEKFYEYPDNLSDLLFDHVAKHPDEFGVVPS